MNAKMLIDSVVDADNDSDYVSKLRVIREIARKFNGKVLDINDTEVSFDIGSIVNADLLLKDLLRTGYDAARNDAVVTVQL